MIKKKYVCKNCGRTFVLEVFEPGEAEDKRVRAVPARCPYCKSTEIKPY